MAESQTPARVSIDEQGRVIITGLEAEALQRALTESQLRPIFANNNVPQCGCNVVQGCG